MNLRNFVAESNRIEGIHREPTEAEIDATETFLRLRKITIQELQSLVSIFAPGHKLRDKRGLNVRVGRYMPPPGGPTIKHTLNNLLSVINGNDMQLYSPFEAHCRYEALHPFTDGNGRSGRALWLWQMKGDAPLGFLHHWYYQSLAAS